MPTYEVTLDYGGNRCTTRREADNAIQAALLIWLELCEPQGVTYIDSREVAA